MSNLINRQDAIDTIDKYIAGFDAIDANFLDGLKTAKQLINDLPAVIPERKTEIVRCKDCKYSDENWRRVSVGWLPCMDVRTGSNWFCGSAERREE